MIRFLPVILLLGLFGVGVMAWKNGFIQNAFDPRVTVVAHVADNASGASVARTGFRFVVRPLSAVAPGVVIVGRDKGVSIKVDDLAESWLGDTYARDVKAGDLVLATDFQRPAPVYGIVASTVIRAGEEITSVNARVRQIISGSAANAAEIMLPSPEAAQAFLSGETGAARAGRRIRRNETVGLRDLMPSDDVLWGIVSKTGHVAGETALASDLEAIEFQAGDTDGAPRLAFDSAASAQEIMAAGAVMIARDVAPGAFIAPLDLALAAPSGDVAQPAGRIPETRAEFDLWIEANPDRGLVIPDGVVLGGAPGSGLFDVWAESGRTDGAFSRVSLVRIAENVSVLRAATSITPVEETVAVAVLDQTGKPTGKTVSEKSIIDVVLPSLVWVNADADAIGRMRQAMDQARGIGDSFFLVTRQGANLASLLGNGVACQDWICSAMLDTPNKLGALRFDQISQVGEKSAPKADAETKSQAAPVIE